MLGFHAGHAEVVGSDPGRVKTLRGRLVDPHTWSRFTQVAVMGSLDEERDRELDGALL